MEVESQKKWKEEWDKSNVWRKGASEFPKLIKDIRQRFGKITNFNKTNTKNTRLRYVKVELLKNQRHRENARSSQRKEDMIFQETKMRF